MRALSLALVLCLASLTTPAHAQDAHAVALLYHRFGETHYPTTDVTLAQFEAHLDYLSTHGYTVWPLQRIVDHLRQNKPMPDKTVAITIDDAYQSVYTQAYPRLKARGWPFTVFVSTDAVDRHFSSFMTWDEMREMRKHGVTFASHTATHAHLLVHLANEDQQAWRERVRQDIEKGHERLKQELGTTSMLFAYPYGEYNTALADLVAKMGFVGFGQQSGALGHDSDMRALPRFPMADSYAAMDEFKRKVASLPFPVLGYTPWDPELGADNLRPRLDVTLGPTKARLNELVCYVSGQGAVPVVWEEKYTRFTVQAPQALPVGRSRYNCTAPNQSRSRYYWFSQQWIHMPGG